jgi:RecB family endonuclease NucS
MESNDELQTTGGWDSSVLKREQMSHVLGILVARQNTVECRNSGKASGIDE